MEIEHKLQDCGFFRWGNGSCDSDLNTAECFFDLGDCDSSACYLTEACIEDPTCDLDNGVCNTELNTAECVYDFGDCAPIPAAICDPIKDCDPSDTDCDVGNGVCNSELNTEACGYDGGDCCESTCVTPYIVPSEDFGAEDCLECIELSHFATNVACQGTFDDCKAPLSSYASGVSCVGPGTVTPVIVAFCYCVRPSTFF